MVKKVGKSLYVHKSNINELLNRLSKDEQNYVLELIDKINFEYCIVKYNDGNVSFIECDTWDILNEPIVGDSHLFKKDGTNKLIKGGRTVYHCKESFVAVDYKGFDIEVAKERTKEWNTIPNIKKIKSKIGNKNFWYSLLKDNNIKI